MNAISTLNARAQHAQQLELLARALGGLVGDNPHEGVTTNIDKLCQQMIEQCQEAEKAVTASLNRASNEMERMAKELEAVTAGLNALNPVVLTMAANPASDPAPSPEHVDTTDDTTDSTKAARAPRKRKTPA